MSQLTQNLIHLWQTASNQNIVDKAISLLMIVFPDKSYEELAQLSIGQRNQHLLRLRTTLLGSQLQGLTQCNHCKTDVEFNFDSVDSLTMNDSSAIDNYHTLKIDDHEIRFRLLNSNDLKKIIALNDIIQASNLLLQNCLLQYPSDNYVLSESMIDAIETRLLQLDPYADIRMDMHCPFCNQSWRATLDIVTFFWQEINNFAQQKLEEVHQLASAYGWNENEIFSLPEAHKQFYLQRLNHQ